MAQFLTTPLGIEEKNVRTIRDACRGNHPWVIFPTQHRPVADLLSRDGARRIAIKMAKLAGAVNVVDPQPITGSAHRDGRHLSERRHPDCGARSHRGRRRHRPAHLEISSW